MFVQCNTTTGFFVSALLASNLVEALSRLCLAPTGLRPMSLRPTASTDCSSTNVPSTRADVIRPTNSGRCHQYCHLSSSRSDLLSPPHSALFSKCQLLNANRFWLSVHLFVNFHRSTAAVRLTNQCERQSH